MSELTRGGSQFIGYDYLEVTSDNDSASMYLDGYENFGWVLDDNIESSKIMGKVIIKLKRDRKIVNKTELTRLQRHFEACMNELSAIEKSKTSKATLWAIGLGIIGSAFLAGSVFAVTHEPPLILLCVLLGIPGILGWLLPIFVFKALVRIRSAQVEPLKEQKYDEIYEICEKGNKLLSL
jgi:hypothetical protein